MATKDKSPLLLGLLLSLVWSMQSELCAGQNASTTVVNRTCTDQLDLYLCHPNELPADSCPNGPVLENVRFRNVDPFGVLFVFTDAWSIILLFTVFLFFNVNIAATPRHSFVFFYQIVPLVLYEASNRINVYFRTGGVLWGTINLNNPAAVTLFSSSLPFLALRYCKLLLIFFLIPLAVLTAKCCSHLLKGDGRCKGGIRKLRRRFAPDGGILKGICSILLFGYNLAIQVSFALLLSTDCCCNGVLTCPRFCQDLPITSEEYAVYWVVAIAVLAVCLVPVVAFLAYPALPTLLAKYSSHQFVYRFAHLVPVFEVYQSHLKPRMRFFSSLYLIYRFALHAVVAFVPDQSVRTLVVTCILIVILSIHLLSRPFSKRQHNYIESLMLLNLIVVSVGMQWIPLLRNRPGSEPAIAFIAVLLGFLTLFPILCVIIAGVVKFAIKCSQKRRKVRLSYESSGGDGNSVDTRDSSSIKFVKEQTYHLYTQSQWLQDHDQVDVNSSDPGTHDGTASSAEL